MFYGLDLCQKGVGFRGWFFLYFGSCLRWTLELAGLIYHSIGDFETLFCFVFRIFWYKEADQAAFEKAP